MKLFSPLLRYSLIFVCIFTGIGVANSQNRNFSDITGPNPGELTNNDNSGTNNSSNNSNNDQNAGTPETTPDTTTVDSGTPETTPDTTTVDSGTPETTPDTTTVDSGTPETTPDTTTVDAGTPETETNLVNTPGSAGETLETGEITNIDTAPETVGETVETGEITTPETVEANPVLETESEIGGVESEIVETVEANPQETPIVDDAEPIAVEETTTIEPEVEVTEAPVEEVDSVISEETPLEDAPIEEISEVELEETPLEDSATEEATDLEPEDALAEEDAVARSQEDETDESNATEEESNEVEDDSQGSTFDQEVDRVAYEFQVQQSSADVAIQLNEEFQTAQLIDYSGVQFYGQAPSVEAISQRLGQLWLQTNKKTAFINISLQSNQLEAFAVMPVITESAFKNSSNPIVASRKLEGLNPTKASFRRTMKNTSRKQLLSVAKKFREEVSDVSNIKQSDYLESSQELYQSLIAPIEAELAANDIDILVFSMDTGLRLLPIAALHDGKQFLIEKYALALVPSFGLTDTRYVNPSNSEILAMGASRFEEQVALPTMPIELSNITRNPRQGEVFLNEDFTVANFKAQNTRQKPFSIIHLGTHAEFKSGNLDDSYIQFYDEKLEIAELRNISDELGWNSRSKSPIELLVLSACQTALGNDQAELGFAGLAVQAGVKSALASLWYVSDLGTLALMSEFYDQLDDTLIKAEALRQTQLQMLTKEVMIEKGKLKLSNGSDLDLPSSFPKGNLSMAHPYFWSSFTLIGNWN